MPYKKKETEKNENIKSILTKIAKKESNRSKRRNGIKKKIRI